jgi:nucleotide-binding universal stress UspA family protein
MIKSMLVPLVGLPSDKIALQTAHAVASLFAAHIGGLHVRPDPVKIALQSAGYDMGTGAAAITPEIVEALREGIDSTAARARRTFDDFCVAAEIERATRPVHSSAISVDYSEVEGDQISLVVAAARTRELTVLGRPEAFSGLGAGGAGDVMVRSGRPILLAATEAPRTFGHSVAIAWKDTAEAGRALTAALPLLCKAHRIAILTAVEGERDENAATRSAEGVAAELRWHGLSPEVRSVDPADDLPAAILNAARKFGADLLVMGGYGHSRAREFLFGGMTRRVLEDAPIPVFMAH